MTDNLSSLGWTDRQNYGGPTFEYKGFQSFVCHDKDDGEFGDGYWYTAHYAVSPEGDRFIINTRYSNDRMTFEIFQREVDKIIINRRALNAENF